MKKIATKLIGLVLTLIGILGVLYINNIPVEQKGCYIVICIILIASGISFIFNKV